MTRTLYEQPPSRSERVRWTFAELGIEYESRAGRSLFGSDELKAVHPLGKMPALIDEGRPLFESAAICTWLADSHPEGNLIAPPGSWERALHDQWVAYTLSEIEAHLWSMARNTSIYPEERRVDTIIAQDMAEAHRSLSVLNDYLDDREYLLGDRLSVTDIIVGYAVNWGRRRGVTDGLSALHGYNDRLLAEPKCPYINE